VGKECDGLHENDVEFDEYNDDGGGEL